MAADGAADETDWQEVAGRALAYLALQSPEIKDEKLTKQATFLATLGVKRREAAVLLGTTDDSLRGMLNRERRAGGGK